MSRIVVTTSSGSRPARRAGCAPARFLVVLVDHAGPRSPAISHSSTLDATDRVERIERSKASTSWLRAARPSRGARPGQVTAGPTCRPHRRRRQYVADPGPAASLDRLHERPYGSSISTWHAPSGTLPRPGGVDVGSGSATRAATPPSLLRGDDSGRRVPRPRQLPLLAQRLPLGGTTDEHELRQPAGPAPAATAEHGADVVASADPLVLVIGAASRAGQPGRRRRSWERSGIAVAASGCAARFRRAI